MTFALVLAAPASPDIASPSAPAPSTTAAGVSGVTYTVAFNTSSTGQLVSPQTITLTAPAGTFVAGSGGTGFTLRNATTANSFISTTETVAPGGGSVTLRVNTATPTAANDRLAITVTNATNAAAGTYTWTIATTSDPTPIATPGYTLGGSDTTPPDTTITAGPSGPTNDSTPTFSFTANEASTFQCRIDTTAFTACSSPHTTAALTQGLHTFEVLATDTAGNVETASATRSFTVDTTPPVTTITSGPTGPTPDAAPTFAFSSSEAGSSFQCRVDTAAFANCSSPHTTAALGAGPHTFEVKATDAAGNVETTAVSRSFTVSAPQPPPDTTPPDTTITSGPSGPTSDATPTFEFSSSEPAGSTFQCSIDNGPFVACSSPFTTPPLGPGAHTFQVRAIDAAGNVDTSPAGPFSTTAGVRAFIVQGALDPPTLAKDVNVVPVSGQVFVSVPAGTARASATVPGIKGRRFVPLSEAKQIPVGSLLDTRRGTVSLTSARDAKGATQSSNFASGVFQVLQSGAGKGLTEARLKGSSFSACATRARGKRSAARARASRSHRTIRRLRGNGKGSFRTRGRYSAATVRGTDWTVSDRCDGTLTKVARGTVAVRDFRRGKTVLVRAGKSYLARAKG